jgi:hypothetical protein
MRNLFASSQMIALIAGSLRHDTISIRLDLTGRVLDD